MKLFTVLCLTANVGAKLADRSRIVQQRQKDGKISDYHDNGWPIEGQAYHSKHRDAEVEHKKQFESQAKKDASRNKKSSKAPWNMPLIGENETPEDFERKLSSQLTGCCSTYSSYGSSDMCALYGAECDGGGGGEDGGKDQNSDCSQKGLAFLGFSFSVNTASGNPYSYQLCDQFPMENIIDRDYEYIMSMDEDGWLLGGGYKAFDYSGKLP
jgi:hypothetical protein